MSEAAGEGAQPGTRERLLLAARALLTEGGYAAATVQAVADRAGVSAGALYRHFPSKAHLCVEVLRAAAQRDLVAIETACVDGGSAAARLEAAVAVHARRALGNRRLAWALLYEPVDALVDEERLVHRRHSCRLMAGLLRDAIAAGELPEQDAAFSAAAVVGAIYESLVGPLAPVGGSVASTDETVAAIVRFCKRSIGLSDVL